MATETEIVAEGTAESSMYELFMGLMTVLSLGVMALIILVRSPEVEGVLYGADALFCVLFLFDFALSLKRAPSKTEYLFGRRPGRSLPQGITDLLGSIPSVGIFRAFRIFRLARIARIVRARGSRGLAREFVNRRAESAIYIIFTAAMLVLLFGSATIAFLEPNAEGSNIANGADAFWWAFVTITTVGYGDRFPVTEGGRMVGILTMAVGIGIFGVLTSFLSSVFLAPRKGVSETTVNEDAGTMPGTETVEAGTAPLPAVALDSSASVLDEIAALRAELAELRHALGAGGRIRSTP